MKIMVTLDEKREEVISVATRPASAETRSTKRDSSAKRARSHFVSGVSLGLF